MTRLCWLSPFSHHKEGFIFINDVFLHAMPKFCLFGSANSLVFSWRESINFSSFIFWVANWFVLPSQEFLGFYYFKSKSHQDEFSPEGLCKAAMFAMHVKEELGSWPEQSTRHRRWLTIPEAGEQCRHPWMREALLEGFSKWHANKMMSAEEDHPGPISSTPARWPSSLSPRLFFFPFFFHEDTKTTPISRCLLYCRER